MQYMKKYNKDNESSYIMYWDNNSLYRWAMSQNSLYMALNGKNTSISNEKLIKKCDEDINKGYMLEVHICRMQFVYLKKTTLRTLKL